MKKIILITVLFIGFHNLFSQVSGDEKETIETDIELREIGIGLHVEQFKLSDLQLTNDLIPTTKIIFTYNYNNKIRIEPKIGLIHVIRDDYKSSGYHFGLGVFSMTQRGRTNIYYGISTAYDILKTEDRDYNGYDNIEKNNRFGIGPKVGGEFFLGKHFSLSGEVGLLYLRSKYTQEEGYNYYDPGDKESKSSSFLIDSGLIIRFYF